MYDNATRGNESPDRQAESTDNQATCPKCGDPVLALVTTGPASHSFAPCGCSARTATARDLTDSESQALTDGGVDQSSETFDCGDCGDEVSGDDVKAVMKRGGDDAILLCLDCQVEHPYDRQFSPTNPAALVEDGDS